VRFNPIGLLIISQLLRSIFNEFEMRIPESIFELRFMVLKKNIFNIAYELLSWKVHRALIKAKLKPYLGFLHSVQPKKPSLVCNFMKLYPYLIENFLIEYCPRVSWYERIRERE